MYDIFNGPGEKDKPSIYYVCPFQASIIGNQGNHKIRNNSQDVSVIQTNTIS